MSEYFKARAYFIGRMQQTKEINPDLHGYYKRMVYWFLRNRPEDK